MKSDVLIRHGLDDVEKTVAIAFPSERDGDRVTHRAVAATTRHRLIDLAVTRDSEKGEEGATRIAGYSSRRISQRDSRSHMLARQATVG